MRKLICFLMVAMLPGCMTAPDLVLYKGDDAATLKGYTSMLDVLGAGLSIYSIDRRYISGYEPTVHVAPGKHEVIIRTSDYRVKYKNVSDTPTYWFKIIMQAGSNIEYEFRPIPVVPTSRDVIFFRIKASRISEDDHVLICKQSGPGSFSMPGPFDCEQPKKMPIFDEWL